jgi:hypothetical protein
LPDIGDRGADQLKREAIESYGSIQILFEDLISVGGSGGLWTAYGYDSVDGPHTGVFVVMVHEGTGYIIDVDGRTENETELLETIGVLTDSWQFRPAGRQKRLGNWVQESLEEFEVAVPADYGYTGLENGWHRFSAEEAATFVAVRTESGDGGPLGQRHKQWLDVAGASAADFVGNEPYEIEYAGQRWLRSDFSYGDPLGDVVMGSIVGKTVEGRLIFTWSEAPATVFEALDQEVFSMVAADVRPGD